jgi:hypothetical protein
VGQWGIGAAGIVGQWGSEAMGSEAVRQWAVRQWDMGQRGRRMCGSATLGPLGSRAVRPRNTAVQRSRQIV